MLMCEIANTLNGKTAKVRNMRYVTNNLYRVTAIDVLPPRDNQHEFLLSVSFDNGLLFTTDFASLEVFSDIMWLPRLAMRGIYPDYSLFNH